MRNTRRKKTGLKLIPFDDMSVFTCISCRVAFADADLQRSHYKTDWHRYNLKRKVAELPPLTAENFQQKVLAQRAQAEEADKDTSSHCVICNKHFSSKNAFDNHQQSKKHKDVASKQTVTPKAIVDKRNENLQSKAAGTSSSLKEVDKNAKNKAIQEAIFTGPAATGSDAPGDVAAAAASTMEVGDADGSDTESVESWGGEALGIEECLFCSRISQTLNSNMEHMTSAHSFFLPDVEFLVNFEGLMTYLGEKVGEGHICLWCNERSRAFQTTKAVQQHMRDKGHCKMLHDGDAVFEYADFYDYRSSYPDQESAEATASASGGATAMEVGDDSEDEVHVEELEGYGYQLVLPSGATVGHRSLLRYYRQKLRPDRAVVAKNPSALSRLMAHYKALGWTGAKGMAVYKRAKDISFVKRMDHKQYMRLGVKANKFQPHFRSQVYGSG